MNALWNHIVAFYKATSTACQFSGMNLSFFCQAKKAEEKFPRLKGKGAECKDLLPTVEHAWSELATGHPQYRLVKDMLGHMVDAQMITHQHNRDIFLPTDKAKEYKRHIDKFLVQYQELAFLSEEAGDNLWNNPIKFHWAAHLAERALYLNPRRGSTLVDEDFMGRIKSWCSSALPVQSSIRLRSSWQRNIGGHLIFCEL